MSSWWNLVTISGSRQISCFLLRKFNHFENQTTRITGSKLEAGVLAKDIREEIDNVLKAPKAPTGETEWIVSPQEDQRLTYALSIDNELSDAIFTIISYPMVRTLQFRLVLSYGKAIWRVDFAKGEDHINPLNRPLHLPLGPIDDPHYHSWPDNRHLATAYSLPARLRNANVLPSNIRTYENTFRWFCGETNIAIPSGGIPNLPRSDRLL